MYNCICNTANRLKLYSSDVSGNLVSKAKKTTVAVIKQGEDRTKC